MNSNLLDRYNLLWESQSENSAGSMPLGGHDIGCNVWVENNELLMYFQQSGGFDENSSMLKQGRVRIAFEENPFRDDFIQKLILHEGYVKICGEGL